GGCGCSPGGGAEGRGGGRGGGVLFPSGGVPPAMIERLVALNAKATGLMVAADNPANVDSLAAAAQKAGNTLGIVVEFDVGQGRTGTTSVEAALALAQRLKPPPPLPPPPTHPHHRH